MGEKTVATVSIAESQWVSLSSGKTESELELRSEVKAADG